MIAPRLFVRFKGTEYSIEQRAGAWAIGVEGGWYFLSGGDPDRAADRFIDARLRNAATPRRPGFLASQRYPLMLSIDGVTVRAWPAEVPRGKGAKTYMNPATGDRVATVKQEPVWMFAIAGRMSAGGTATAEQTLDDVSDLAKVWLRTS